MADNTAEQKPRRKRQKVEKVDLKKPVYAVIWQTDTATKTALFTGPDAETEARNEANRKAVKSGHTVAVFGPQQAAYEAPKAPPSAEITLDWQ